jgi:carboxymethylenebutenolidase
VCFDLDSTPPIPVIAGAAVSHEDLVLEAADGNQFAAFAAIPGESAQAGVVVLPDVRGLYHFYEELALRFAEHGILAIAIDYFGRTAGVGERGDDFEYRPHVDQTEEETVQADIRAAVQWLRDRGARAVFTVGFCFGGRKSWLAAASGHGLAGAIGFYGRTGAEPAEGVAAPILALQGGDDQNISAADNQAFDEALTAAGVEHEVVTYEGAPHSFFDRRHGEFAAASEDAWGRVLAFIDRYTPQSVSGRPS